MRIQYMSDLHMELYDNSRYLKAKEFDANGDVLGTPLPHRRSFGAGPRRTSVRC